MSRKLAIVGAGDHGRVVLDTARAQGWDVAGFIDKDKLSGTEINGASVLGHDALLSQADFLAEHAFIVAISHQRIRRALSAQIREAGGELASVIHPNCVVSDYARIGDGCMLIAGTIVNANAHVGDFSLLNTNCTVDHDAVLGTNVQVGPGANLSGNVTCGNDVVIGTGAVVIPRVMIGQGATVGAGAVVIRDIDPGDTVVGNPARSKRGV
jgi:sugar O-acyltransferase (sialic acid O-acetyltransferase NeuD family)